MEQFLSIADHMAVAVFAVTGALMASRKQMDIFGFIMLGTVTGVGGGSLRDLLLGAPVFWIAAPGYIATCVVAASATFFLAHLAQSRYRVILWLDAVGLALFAVLGAEKTLALGVSSIIALVMGVMSATFGGIIRDVLGGEVPLLLRREIYVTAALAGAAVFVGLSVLGLSPLAPRRGRGGLYRRLRRQGAGPEIRMVAAGLSQPSRSFSRRAGSDGDPSE